MQKINRDKFVAALQISFDGLSEKQVTALNIIVDCLEADVNVNDPRWSSYMLASSFWETGQTWEPIEEYGKGAGHPYGVPDSQSGLIYYGRGYVQLTWKGNYATFTGLLHHDLVSHPEDALDPAIAYQIMSIGMRKGLFTGVGLGRYFNENVDDPVNARKIINGLDQAERIASYHTRILAAIKESIQ